MTAAAPRGIAPAGIAITPAEFERVCKFAYDRAGISMAPSKKALVESRLGKRVVHTGCASYTEYLALIAAPDGAQELQTALDLLTTNETYFFREPQHFDHLRAEVVRKHRLGTRLRIWSAACSTGEEPYSIAMLLTDARPVGDWDVVASDLSTQVLAKARTGHYSMSRTQGIPQQYLRAYCLKGTGPQAGTLRIDQKVRSRVEFMQANLIGPLPNVGQFDVIFLRNVMIYFDLDTKRRVVSQLVPHLQPGGYFYIGHSETLNGVTSGLEQIGPAIYRKGAV